MCFTFSFFNRAVYEITWKNIVEPERPHMTMWCMRISHKVAKSANTHSEYIIDIALQLQQWIDERASMLRCTYIACLVFFFFFISDLTT